MELQCCGEIGACDLKLTPSTRQDFDIVPLDSDDWGDSDSIYYYKGAFSHLEDFFKQQGI